MIFQYMIVLTVFLATIFVEVYCLGELQRNENLNTKNSNVKGTTTDPRKRIQQANISIINEQAALISNAFNPDVNSNQGRFKGGVANSHQPDFKDRNVNSQANSNPQKLRSQDDNSNQLGFRNRGINFNPHGFMGSSNSTQNLNTKLKKKNDKRNQSAIVANNGDVSDEELREFSEMLLQKDSNNAMQYVTLNLQGMTTSRSTNDAAPLPLLTLKEDTYKIPSIEKIMLLYNNYFLDAGQNEVYTGHERIEENNLLDTVLATPVMQHARNFLIQKGNIGKDPKEFKDLLRLIWFNMYSRGQGRIGSSGFEHVFLVEIKNNQVSGLHNWLYFYKQEQQRRANYLGYLKKIDLGEKGAIVKYHFTFDDIDKPVGSMFIGTSPELEMALYSTCFILRADKICPLEMNGNRFVIRTYTFKYRGKNMIGSAFPEI